MKKIIIIGGGGFGRELFGYLTADIEAGRLKNRFIAGVLDDNPSCELIKSNSAIKYLGKLSDFSPDDEDFLIAVGRPSLRRIIYSKLNEIGIVASSYVHPSALILKDSTVGHGTIVCPNSIILSGSKVGVNVLITQFCSIGHGASVGDHSVLSPFSALSGDSVLGDDGFMGTRATLFPSVVIGKSCTVDAHSVVRQSTGDRKIISVRGTYRVLENRFIK